MDLRVFFQKIRETEGTIASDYVVVASLETPDGGRPGLMTEVARAVAARLIVEGRARIANDEETGRFYAAEKETREQIEYLERAKNVRLTVVADDLPLEGKTKNRPRNPDK